MKLEGNFKGGLKMAKSTFAIMGATGHIGHYLTEELLKKNHKVRALGRDPHKLQELKEKGAEILSGDFTDADLLAKAFQGCHAVFSFIPPGYTADDMEVLRDRTAEATVQAIAKAKISHALNLSAIGAHLSSGTGPIKELHRQEERLNLIPNLNVLHFRPAFFMENLLWSFPEIKNSGNIAMSLREDLPIPMVATRDIALKIAELLDVLKFTGSSVFEFVGPQEMTMIEATKVIGKAIGKSDLKYVPLSYEQDEKRMIDSGMKHQVAKLMVEMWRAFNDGKIVLTQQLTPEHRGKTTFNEYSKEIAQIYHSAKKVA
jgi:uncharacterized protein YbjT (DUF2867 family)